MKNNFNKYLILFAIIFSGMFFVLDEKAQAATYYVDKDSKGGTCNDANAGTISSPWCTIDKANKTLAAGDTVYIRAATYNIGNWVGDGGSVNSQGIIPNNSGTSGNPITYSTYQNEVVNFVGIETVGHNNYSMGINLEGKNYIHVTGNASYNMKFIYLATNFMMGGNLAGSYNEIDHCDFGTFYPAATWPNFRGATIQHGSQYNYIHDNTFHDWQKYDWSPNNENYDGPVCLEIGEEEGTAATSFNVIENNVMYHCGHHVFGMAGRFNVFRKNIVHNEDYWVGPAIGTFAPNETTYASRNIYGYRNVNLTTGMSGYVGNHLVEDNRIGPSGISTHSWYADSINNYSQRGGTSFYINSSDNMIRYNALYGSVGKGAYFRSYAPGGQVIYNYLYNNTFYSSGYSIENDISCRERYPIVTEYNATYNHDNVIKNNLFRSTWPQMTSGPDISKYDDTNCGTRPLANVIINEVSPDDYPTPSYTIANNVALSESVASPFINPDMSNVYSETLPDLRLLSSATGAIDQAGALTTTTNSGSNSTVLTVNDARYFQDGKFGQDITWPVNISSQTTIVGDWIAIGTVDNVAQIVSISSATSIVLASPISWSNGASVWLYKKSDGERVLYGNAPDAGAYEYTSTSSCAKGDFSTPCNGFEATDIQTMINIILKIETTPAKIDQAKMNAGDTVDATDLQLLINKVLGIN